MILSGHLIEMLRTQPVGQRMRGLIRQMSGGKKIGHIASIWA